MKNYKKIFYMVFLFLFLGYIVVYAIDTVLTGWRATSSEKRIDAHDICYNTKTTSGLDVFVPTKSELEYGLFLANKPDSVDISKCCVSNQGANCGEVTTWTCRLQDQPCYKYGGGCTSYQTRVNNNCAGGIEYGVIYYAGTVRCDGTCSNTYGNLNYTRTITDVSVGPCAPAPDPTSCDTYGAKLSAHSGPGNAGGCRWYTCK